MRPISRRKLASTLVVAAIALLLGGWKLDSLTCCSGPARPAVAVATATAMPPPTAAASVTREAAPTIERLVPEVISTRPHDTTSFTEGFELIDGVIYESDGLYGESTMRRADPKTGEILTVVDVPPDYFAEGIAVVGDKVIQMTWKEDTAFVYDAETLKQVGTLSYTGEGWGMCYDGESLYQSDGSATIFQRDPTTFAVTGRVDVTFQGQPVNMINELECVGDHLYANIWLTDFIIRLDKTTGVIDGVIDATGLLTPEETTAVGSQGVLNGIAYDPDADTFLITGKLWPKVFEVRFVPFTG